MAVKIEIQSTEVKNKSGVAKGSGKPYSINEQVGYLHKSDKPYPEEITVPLQDGQPAYAPGFYGIADQSFYRDRFGQLSIGRLTLIPMAQAAGKAA